MSNQALQLQMNFSSGTNRLRDWMSSGSFCVLIEYQIAQSTKDKEQLYDDIQELATLIDQKTFFAGISLTGGPHCETSWDIVELADSVDYPKDCMLLCLPGRNHDIEQYKEILDHVTASGYPNVVPVTGETVLGENERQTRRRCFTEGIHGIHYLRSRKGKLSGMNIGAPANPFKYTPQDLLAQYHKVVKKIVTGADYLITHYGWDLQKLQELQWYLSNRGYHIPVINRILMLTPERVDAVLDGQYPGTHISPDFKVILNNEAQFSSMQFEFAQWRRLQLHISGSRFLGFNGVQIAGLRNLSQVKSLFRFIKEAMSEYTSFAEWRDAYQEHMARAEMAPYPHRFYLFQDLLSQVNLKENLNMNRSQLKRVSLRQRFRHKLCRLLFAKASRRYPDELLVSKKLLAGCRRCTYCRLPLTQYVCPETCPKGLANGPCGGTKADGKCEVSSKECIHSYILRLATMEHALDSLEERYIRAAEKL